uniref:Transposase Tc1-like domain-containing protein n=1 Tax=Oryzias sinensis TaxID=183150 RepID=A0A8C7Y8F6_9TELE
MQLLSNEAEGVPHRKEKGRSDRTSGPHLLRISKQLEVPVSTVAHIIQKFKTHGTVANLTGRWKRNIDDKLRRRIVVTVSKEPRTTSKDIKGELLDQGTSVSDRTIRGCLSQSGLHRRRPRRTPLLKGNHQKARLELAKNACHGSSNRTTIHNTEPKNPKNG